ncbi:MAG: twin-arginine translocation signal domain-containing protein [Betaproteobacteria bacterium]|nr:twin-arginine translocation signal domain-containing protein [Betaproteobacteria bacterium]
MSIKSVSRRKFLMTLGVGGAAAAAAVTGRQRAVATAPKPAAARQGKGYQLTEHVRRYYETAKV